MALDYPRNGALHGVLGVDYQCYRQARQAGLTGSFWGLLAPASKSKLMGGNLESIVRFQDRNVPIVNARVSVKRYFLLD